MDREARSHYEYRVPDAQTPPAVSVIILSYGGLADTRACLRSLLADARPDLEILVWDNGSPGDDASALEREFAPRVRVLHSPRNLGVAGGYNAAAAHARAPLLVFLNNDTEVTPGWLDPLLRTLARDARIAVCQPKILSLAHPGRFDYSGGCGGFLDRHGFPYTRGRVFGTIEEDRGQYDDAREIHWASAACMLVRRDAWERLGGADEGFFAYMDEVDFCWRARREGWTAWCAPASVIRHRGGRVLGKRALRKRFLEHRNNLLMLLKNLPAARLATVLPQRLLLEAAALAYYLCRGEWRHAAAAPAALASAILRAPAALRARTPSRAAAPIGKRSVVAAYYLRGRRTFAEMHAD